MEQQATLPHPIGAPQADLITVRVRGIAARAIRAGESRGVGGSALVVSGLTLARRSDAVGHAAVDALRDPAAVTLLARDLAQIEGGSYDDAGSLHGRLRWALAPAVRLASAGVDAPDLTLSLDAERPPTAWSDPAFLDAARAVGERLTRAGAWPTHRAGAIELKDRIDGASWLVRAPPAWLSPASRDALSKRFAAALIDESSTPGSPAARAEFDALVVLRRIAVHLDSGRQAAALKASREAFGELAAMPGDGRPDTAVIASWTAMLPRRQELAREALVVQPLRPAVRTIADLTAASEALVLAVLPGAIRSSSAATSPAVVQAVAEHRRRMDDFELIHRASAAIAKGEVTRSGPAARDEFTHVARRLLDHAKDAVEWSSREGVLARESLRSALGRLRSLAGDAADFALLPGEDELRSGAWDGMLGGRAAELITMIDASRAAWARGWANPDSPVPSAEAARLRPAVRLARVARDAAWALRDEPAHDGVWLWTVAPEDVSALARGVGASIERAADLVIRGDAGAGTALDSLEDRYAVVLACGAVRRSLRARSIGPEATGAWSGLSRGVDEGLPGGADTVDLARYVYEAAGALRAGDEPRARSIITALTPIAARVRASCDPAGS
ncbi:MAG: hypothetical protein HRU70_07595 [Phycisphaeraceae bacterium]|nr:MAG: hypothetical protein HRU70_07595 [Phycisphaeraceae bacterium]